MTQLFSDPPLPTTISTKLPKNREPNNSNSLESDSRDLVVSNYLVRDFLRDKSDNSRQY